MRILYFDAFAGISGDMTVGALLDAGVSFEHLQTSLRLLGIDGYHVTAEPRQVNGIGATKFNVHLAHQHHGHDHHHDESAHTHRAYRDIRAIIAASSLSDGIKATARRIFDVLARAEGHIHGVPIDEVTFHEVGAIDSIVDIVATAIAIETLGLERIYVSALPLGSGVIKSQHGMIPVPAPATAELLKGFVTRAGDGEGELVTPTGAAIIAALASAEPPPSFLASRIGYGAGTRAQHDRPNLLRVVVGDTAAVGQDEIVMIETNIDDLNPEFYDHISSRLFEAGARDVFLTSVQMKKNRPGVVLTVMAVPADRDKLAAILLNETSAIGVRFSRAERMILPRQVREVATPFGTVRVKFAQRPDGGVNVAPEYDDCHRLAREHQVPIRDVFAAAVAAAGTAADQPGRLPS